jgi:RNA ligase (TIGR02306 family)
MSVFKVEVVKLHIAPHPDADVLELAQVGGYVAVVRKGEFRTGDLAVYIPEGAVVPTEILARMGLEGKLAGPQKNRVKAARLRGVLSQGLVGSFKALGIEAREGDDVAERLGITKYEPPIPVALGGEVFNAGRELTLDFDVQNWKSYPDILQEGEEVIFTEKLHGTCTIVAILPYKDAHPEAFGERKNVLIFSKGLGAKGLAFKNNERNKDNLYARATRALVARINEVQRDTTGVVVPNFILGETFGPGVQDLTYGNGVGFRVFAAAYGYRGDQRYQSWSFVEGSFKAQFNFETVPVLYRGPFSVAAMREHTDGKTAMGADHIREGIVMVPAVERTDPRSGRVCLKSVSADYLTRKNGTEYN